jgi:hypothetical protein
VVPDPHEPSVETFRVDDGEEEDEVLVEVDVVEVLEEVLEVVGFEEDVVDFEEVEVIDFEDVEVVDVFEADDDDDDDDDVHTPKADWQPVPQYALVVPHQPYWLQQFPDGQVYPLVPPQLPSGETVAALGTGLGTAAARPASARVAMSSMANCNRQTSDDRWG